MNIVLDNVAECIHSAHLTDEEFRTVMVSMQRLLDSLSRLSNRPLSLASVPRMRYSEILQSAPVVPMAAPRVNDGGGDLRIRLMSLGEV